MMNVELNDLFDYGKFIYQNKDYFKFSIDSVLLAELVDLKNGQKKLLDLCSGNAPVPMILATKYPYLDITGVELQKEIFQLGYDSIRFNRFNNINFINEDVKNISNLFSLSSFDIVTANPPYFKTDNKELINDNSIKAIARHEITLSLEDLILNASKMLKNQGYFYMVHRPERLSDIIILLNKYHFGLKKIVPVFDNENSECKIILIESIYNGKDYVKINKPIYLNKYTSYKNIFRR